MGLIELKFDNNFQRSPMVIFYTMSMRKNVQNLSKQKLILFSMIYNPQNKKENVLQL